MNLIKKMLTVIGAFGLAGSSTAIVVACGPQNNELQIVLAPNLPEEEINFFKKNLSLLIQNGLLEKGFNKKVVIETSNDYSVAAQSVNSGNAAIGWIPTFAYYEYGLKNDDKNSFHSLMATTYSASRAEYDTSRGNNKEEKVKQMNENGRTSNMSLDSPNIYKLVLDSAPRSSANEIIINDDNTIGASYYRGYQYISKLTFKKYYEIGRNSNDPDLKRAWTNLVKIDSNSKYAVFNNSFVDEATSQNIQDYWRIVWDVYQQATLDKGIALSNDKASSSARINAIWAMMEVYLLSQGKDANNEANILEAQNVVLKLLDKKFIEVKNYSVDIVHDLMYDASPNKDKDESRISVGAGTGNARVVYKGTDYTPEQTIDELMVLTTSHGIFNDGVVYSDRYFNGKKELLKAMQNVIIDLFTNNQEVKDYFQPMGVWGYIATEIDEDGLALKKYEDLIKQYYNSEFLIKAKDISNSIHAK